MGTTTKDRRKNPRVKTTELPIQIGKADDYGHGAAILRNISLSGLQCQTRARFDEMALVSLTVCVPALPEEERESYEFSAQGAVVRCERAAGGNSRHRFDTSVFFTEISDEDRAILEQFIEIRAKTD